ncbi:Conserved_hypothetical protein [Hexamita inflata]|uniref:Uncharacterized protein n=1 Tax=Hexamita inflata TaxID=28002 RepID=A0AA86NTS0_9EUKA|nr:Conserved hypothetical protein [Hexamita inflata]CAI9951403.1 Conserved hypothetical protein [Hexamita inflata]
MSLASSSLRTFTLLDSKNALIFSTVSLSSEFSSQISAIPCTIATLGASFDLNIESWRTDERSCCFARFPMVAEYSTGDYQTFPVFAFGTAEATMSSEELQQRCIIYFRVCQALLQPTEFRPPWSCSMQTLSISPTYLLSVLVTAEKLMDLNPAILHHCFRQYPPVGIKQLENGPTSPCRLLKKIVDNITESPDIPVSLIQEILYKMQIVVFIDDQVFGTFSASSVQGQQVVATKVDPLDVIVLTILQADEQFMHGKQFSYDLEQNDSQTLLNRMKKVITDQMTEDCAVETQAQVEMDGRRIIQLRINNKLTSVVAVFRSVELNVPLPEGYPTPKCRICYLHPITAKLASVLTQYCGGKLPNLIERCYSFTGQFLVNFEKYIVDDTYLYVLNSHNPERSFSLRYQISAHPGLLYQSIKNLSRGGILAPNLEVDDADISSIIKVDKQAQETTATSQADDQQPFIRPKNQQQKLYNEPPIMTPQTQPQYSPVMQLTDNSADLIKQIQKQFKIARSQVAKLLQMEHQALGNGITYNVEKDGQFTRVFWVFYYNVTPAQDGVKTPITASPIQGLWQSDSSLFPCPLSRQQLIQLNQCEEVVKGKRTEYTEQGGYIGTPQYWASVEKASKDTKSYKKFMGQFQTQGCTFELFEVQAVFLNLVSTDDVKLMTNEIFKKFANLVWGDYYGTAK